MQYVRFGNTDMTVSRLCLGGMMFSRKIDIETTRRVIDEALERGVNFIDTAESYTDSEDYIGRAMEGRRDKVFIATKVYTKRVGEAVGRNSRQNIEASLDRSLQQLRTDRIDLFQLHHPDSETALDETLETLDRAIRQGKVRYVGVTNHYAWQCAAMIERAKARGSDPIVSLQFRYNVLDRPVEVESIPMAQRFGLATMAYAPLCGGMLSGKYSRDDRDRSNTRAAGDAKLQKLLENDSAFAVIDQLKHIAAAQNVQLPQLAMLWLMARPFVTTPIVGGSKLEHFRLMYDVADRSLPPDVVQQIDELSAEFIHRRFENQPSRDGPPLNENDDARAAR
jgi:aryl-alcohol dehydrogenase-like predicted oxidoreductase